MKTYLISETGGLIYDRLCELMQAANIRPYPDGRFVANGMLLRKDEPCDISYVDILIMNVSEIGNRFDHNAYTIKADWQSLHEGESEAPLTLKDRLHHALADTGIVAKTWQLEQFTYPGDGAYIFRPSDRFSCAGMDIMVAGNAEEAATAADFYKRKIEARQKYHKLRKERYKIIVSEYIMRPLLFEGRKFHLRMYGISRSTHPGEYKIARNVAKILTASLPFVLADWNNKAIHDTHLKTSPRDLTYPDDFERQDLLPSINEQLDQFEKHLAKVFTPKPYSGAKRSFSVNGLDIMVREDGRLVLIEVNDRVGYAAHEPTGPKHQELCKRYCEWLAGFIID